MSVHHIINEETALESCPYCGKQTTSIEDWSSICELNKCYWIGKCTCGKEVWLPKTTFNDCEDRPCLDTKVNEAN